MDIININDDLIRASEAAVQIADGDNLEHAHKVYVDGVMLISRNIIQSLAKNGVEEIESLNMPFNPEVHEAIEFDTSDQVTEDTVTRVHQKGFRIDQFIIRTSKVKVTKAPRTDSASAESSGGEESIEQKSE